MILLPDVSYHERVLYDGRTSSRRIKRCKRPNPVLITINPCNGCPGMSASCSPYIFTLVASSVNGEFPASVAHRVACSGSVNLFWWSGPFHRRAMENWGINISFEVQF